MDRGITKPAEVTKPVLESYQRWLFYFRRPSGKALTFSSQRIRMQKLRGLFKYLARQNAILANPAADLELPRVPRRLPKAVLSEKEIERVMAIPDLTDPLGIRDRAMMEVMYSSGARRAELANLELFDIDAERHVLAIRVGKGRKDRMVPIGERALHWVGRYLDEVRPELVVPPDMGVLFLDEETGERMRLPRLTQLMKRYVDAAQLGKSGACHILRHAMATHMLEGGCDVRLLQEILGHAELSTTAIYTRISIKHLVRVHEQTHPASRLDSGKATTVTEDAAAADALLAALETEDDEEVDVAVKDDGG